MYVGLWAALGRPRGAFWMRPPSMESPLYVFVTIATGSLRHSCSLNLKCPKYPDSGYVGFLYQESYLWFG